MTKIPIDDSLGTRVKDLEDEWARLMQRIDDAERAIAHIRNRLATLLPERHHCKWCKGLIHPLSEVCGSCGRSLRPGENPKAGQPR